MVFAIKCAICLEIGILDLAALTPCGHVFHHACLLGWLNESKTCPTCRSESNDEQIARLYFEGGYFEQNPGADDNENYMGIVNAAVERMENKMEADFQTRQQALNKMETELAAIKSGLQAMGTENDTLREGNDTLRAENGTLGEENDALKQENDALKAMLVETLAEREKLKKALKRKNRKGSGKKAPSTADQNGALDASEDSSEAALQHQKKSVGKRRGRNDTTGFSASSSISQPSRKKA